MGTQNTSVDVVVVGSGAAGLFTALSLAPLSVLLVTKAPALVSGSTAYAQGGMAAVMGADDTPAEHTANTLFAGAGLVDKAAADVLTHTAPAVMRQLMDLGMVFDKTSDGELSLGREAAHTKRRILHAGGDATGRHLSVALAACVEKAPHVQVALAATVWQVLTDENGTAGVLMHQPQAGWARVACRHVVLATGGVGQLFSHTTNPTTATADGLRLAWEAGAALEDMEFVQFHPTTLDVAATDGRRPLLTEALRGEGAHLLDAQGTRFMLDVHPDAELAPRDVVARAVWARRAQGAQVFLDARALAAEGLAKKFPTVWALCAEHGLDPAKDLLPIAPAAHYHMGGVKTDLLGRTNVAGLWAVGEVARTGLHGANRLASNSLTECLVFGARAAEAIKVDIRPFGALPGMQAPVFAPQKEATPLRAELQQVMYAGLGLVRDGKGMQKALARIQALTRAYKAGTHDALTVAAHAELQSLLLAARLMTEQALKRTESRGGHYRSDYPKQSASWQTSMTIRKPEEYDHDRTRTRTPATAVL